MDENHSINDLKKNLTEGSGELTEEHNLSSRFETISQSFEVAEIIELRNRFGITSPCLLAKAMRMPEVQVRRLLMLWDSLFLRE